MRIDTSRRTLLVGGTALALALGARMADLARGESLPEVTVYKSPT